MNLRATHPAILNSTTIHPSTIKVPTYGKIFKSADMNTKLGGCSDWAGSERKRNKKNKDSVITNPKWFGQRFYYNTLTERETCPTDCKFWTKCYGNSMGFAHRMQHGQEIEDIMMWEMESLSLENRNKFFTIRPHVLGDFYSLKYVELWDKMLTNFRVNAFGYTAYLPDSKNSEYSEIGQALIELREKHTDRFWIRQSGGSAPTMSALGMSNPLAKEQLKSKKAFICPNQQTKKSSACTDTFQPKRAKNCASCGLCYRTKKNVVFLEH